MSIKRELALENAWRELLDLLNWREEALSGRIATNLERERARVEAECRARFLAILRGYEEAVR